MNQNISGINPNIGQTAEAMAGNQAISFTATDRKIIEERGVNLDKKISFREAISQKGKLVPDVENEETPIRSTLDVKDVQSRYNEHKQMLKDSPLRAAKDKTEISKEAQENSAETTKPGTPDNNALHEKTIAAARELKFDAKDLLEKFALSQDDLRNLISKIKDLHLKRLLTENHQEFAVLSEKIIKDSSAYVKPQAKEWLKEKLDELTLEAAIYKANLMQSLQIMDFDPKREKAIKWLKQTVTSLQK